jgi:hypothetical protein
VEAEPYRITNIEPDFAIGANGSAVDGYRVSFTTAGGRRSHVKVPRSTDLETDIHTAVANEAQMLDRAMTMPAMRLTPR